MLVAVSYIISSLAIVLFCTDAFLITSPLMNHHLDRNRISIPSPLFGNIYDQWRSDMTVDTMPLEEEFVQICLEEMIYSDYGQEMFGIHDRAGTFSCIVYYICDMCTSTRTVGCRHVFGLQRVECTVTWYCYRTRCYLQ